LKTIQLNPTRLVVLIIAGLAAALGIWWSPALAQSGGWSVPLLIFEGRGVIHAPALIADPFGQVHGFWLFLPEQPVSERQSQLVYYTRLDQPTWPVNDVFAGVGSGATLAAAAGSDGLALLWGGENFAWTGVSPRATAQDWTGPVDAQGGLPESGLTTAPDGSIWLAYGTKTNEIYVQRFNPNRLAWEAARLVGDPTNPNTVPSGARLAFGADGTMHVVWVEFQLPIGWPPVGLYYSRSSDGGQSWTGRRRLAGAQFNQPNVVTGPDQQVYLTWTGTAGTGQKYFQESLDGGQTWGGPVTVMKASGGGSEGPPDLAVDSAGNLHMVFSHNGCVWYTSRINNTWTDPECISLGAAVSAHIEHPTMALGLGNRVHVLFWTDQRQLWYMSLQVPVSGFAPQATPTEPAPTATITIPTATPTATPTHLPDLGPFARPEQATEPGIWALVAGVVPVAVLLLAVLAQRVRVR
jgi:hypothetical protein